MGVDKYLYHNNECVADLGRAYHYNNEPLSDNYISTLKLELFATARIPFTIESVEEITERFYELLDAIIEDGQRRERNEVINTILKDGALVVRDE